MAENKKYLDIDGLSYFWGKVKDYVDTAGVVSFGGAKGAVLVDTVGTAVGSVKFTMSGQTLTGAVTGFGNLATKTEAVGAIKVAGSVNPTASSVAASVTITPVSVSGSNLTPATASITIPAATEDACGVVTLGTIKNLAATAATSTYKVKGSKESLAAVLAVPSAVVGDVYNITAQFTLGGKPYPAGTNVVFIGHGESEGTDNPKLEAQWDALGGTVDLSPYATITALTEARNALSGQINAVDGKVGGLTTTVNGHTDDIAALKAADDTLSGRIGTLESWKGTTSTTIEQHGNAINTLNTWMNTPITTDDIDDIFK